MISVSHSKSKRSSSCWREIVNDSDHSITMPDGRAIDPGEKVGVYPEDKNGLLNMGDEQLPYGNFSFRELNRMEIAAFHSQRGQ